MSQKLRCFFVKDSVWLLTATTICLTVVLVLSPSASGQLVARYAFTSDANDSLSGMAGTMCNGATITNGSVVMDGTDDYVDLGAGFGYNVMPLLTGNFSVETWVRWSGQGGLNQQIFDFGNGTDPTTGTMFNHMYLSANAGTATPGNVQYTLEPTGANTNAVLNGPALGTSLTHIVVTYNITQTTPSILATKTMYVNGQLVAVHIPTAAPTPRAVDLGTTLYNYLGRYQDDTLYPNYPNLNGSIDEFRIWNNGLSALEVSVHYAAGDNSIAVWHGDGNFSDPSHWDNGVVPGPSTIIYFPSGTCNLNGVSPTVAGSNFLGTTITDTGYIKGVLTSSSTISMQNGTVSAKLGGTAGLNKSTTGSVDLNGANTFTGGVTLNAGILRLGNNNALGPAGSNLLTISNEGTILNMASSNATVAGLILNNGCIVGDATYGPTLTSLSTFDLRTGAVGVTLAGTYGLIKSTTGSVLLGAPNTYTGGTTVGCGVLSVNSNSNLGANVTGNDVTLNSGGTLLLALSTNIGTNQKLIINYGAVFAPGWNLDQSFLNKCKGTGVIAAGYDNSNNLDFSIPHSQLSLGSAGISTYSGMLTPNYNTYRLGGGWGTLNMSSNLVDNGSTKRGLIVCDGGTGGTVYLTGTNNSYSGGTTIIAGKLLVDAASKLGSNSPGNVVRVQNGTVLQMVDVGNIGSNQGLTLDSGGVVNIGWDIDDTFLNKPTSGSQGTISIATSSTSNLNFITPISLGAWAPATVSGTITPYQNVYRFAGGGDTLTVASDLTDGSVRSLVISAGSGGSVVLNPYTANTYTGGTTVNGATLQLGGANALPTTGILTVNGGTMNLGTFTSTVDSVVLNGGTISNGTITATSAYTALYNGTVSAALAQPLNNPDVALTKSGAGTLVLQGTNSFTGKVAVTEGTLQATEDLALGAAPTALTPDAITLSQGATLSLAGFDSDANRGITLAGTATIDHYTGNILRWNSPITGSGGLILTGSGDTGFSAVDAVTYTGDTTIVNCTLSSRGANVFPYGPGKGNMIIQAGGMLNVRYADNNINGLYGEGTIKNSEYATQTLTLGNNDANGDFSGVIGVVGQAHINITKVGTGTQIFSGISNVYNGPTTISAGTLSVTSLAAGSQPSSIGMSDATSTNLIIGSNTSTTSTLKYIGYGDTTDRCFQVGLSAALDASGAGPIVWEPTPGEVMGWVGTGPHTLTLTGTNDGDNTLGIRIVDTDDGAGTTFATSLVKDGTGKWVLSTNMTYKGNTTVSAGILDALDINTPNATVSVQSGELDAASVRANTVTVGAGGKIVLKASGGGLSAGGSLTPIPEPSTLILFSMAIASLLAYAGRLWVRQRLD